MEVLQYLYLYSYTQLNPTVISTYVTKVEAHRTTPNGVGNGWCRYIVVGSCPSKASKTIYVTVAWLLPDLIAEIVVKAYFVVWRSRFIIYPKSLIGEIGTAIANLYNRIVFVTKINLKRNLATGVIFEK